MPSAIDLTRRDRQRDARDLRLRGSRQELRRLGAVRRHRAAGAARHFNGRAITLSVNGTERQRGDIGQMIWSVPEVIAQLSKQVTLGAGDLIYTGTPAGVGPVVPGDLIAATLTGCRLYRHHRST